MSFLKVANRAISSLASGVDDAVTEWTLATGEGALFPSSGDFHVTCEDEIGKCTARTGDVLTVVRAQEGTAAAAHASGKAVKLQITAEIITELQTAVDVRLKAPTGTAEWENRTYAGWELLTTDTTYTVGSGQDFETLADAAASLQGLILVGTLKVQFQEKITLTSDVTFKSLISAGGVLQIDQNGYDLEIDDGCEMGLRFQGQFTAQILNTGGACSVKMIADSLSPPYYLMSGEFGCFLNPRIITLDANSKSFVAMVRIIRSKGDFYTCTYSNDGSLSSGAVYATQVSHGGFTNSDPSNMTADRGSILIKSDGTVVTT